MIKQVTKASVGYVVAGLLLLLTSFNAVAEPDIFYFHNDHLGTPQVLTDQDQNVVWKANYTPFGYADIVVEDIEMNVRFPGQYYDKETGYHYNYFRTYDPSMGRYLQSDPIGLNGGLNTYGYVGGNPLLKIDPQGLHEGTLDRAASFARSYVAGEADRRNTSVASLVYYEPRGNVIRWMFHHPTFLYEVSTPTYKTLEAGYPYAGNKAFDMKAASSLGDNLKRGVAAFKYMSDKDALLRAQRMSDTLGVPVDWQNIGSRAGASGTCYPTK